MPQARAGPDDPGAAWCEDYKAAYAEKFPGEAYALFSAYGHDAVSIFADAARKLMADGQEVTRETLNEQHEKFDGSLQTSHGKSDSEPRTTSSPVRSSRATCSTS